MIVTFAMNLSSLSIFFKDIFPSLMKGKKDWNVRSVMLSSKPNALWTYIFHQFMMENKLIVVKFVITIVRKKEL